MQLASIVSTPATITVPMQPAGAPQSSIPLRAAASMWPAAAGAPAPIEGAIDGVARLGSGPIIDFPGIVAGNQFDIVKGSKVGFLGVKGEAGILQLDDDHASFKIKAGALGVKVDLVVDVVRTGADTVRISSRGTGVPDTSAEGRIVAQRTNYAEFERIDNPRERTIIQHDGRGGIVIDTVVPTFGAAHLVLQRRA